MTREDKDLLFKDLCARLPYGVKIKLGDYDYQVCGYNSENPLPLKIWYYYRNSSKSLIDVYLEDYHPYLRPMSSMTEEERKEYKGFIIHREHVNAWGQEWDIDCFSFDGAPKLIDWLNAHHFDFRNLIKRGLAIEVTEENNPYKE